MWILDIVLCVMIFILLRILFYQMAKRNVLFTLKTEGEFVAVVKGNDFDEFIYSTKNSMLNEDCDVKPDTADEGDYRWRRKGAKLNPMRKFMLRPFFHFLFGVIWIGFPPYRVLTYTFRRIKYSQVSTNGANAARDSYQMIERVDEVDSLFFQYPAYGLPITDAETGAGNLLTGTTSSSVIEKVPVVCNFVFSTRTTNPYKTLFESTGLTTSGDWIIKLTSVLRARLKAWIGSMTYEALVTAHKKQGEDLFKDVLEQVKIDILDVGQEVTAIQFINVDLANPELQRAAERLFIAKQSRLAAEETTQERIRLSEATRAENMAKVAGTLEAIAARFPDGKIPPEQMAAVIRLINNKETSANLTGLKVLGDNQVIYQDKEV